VHYFWFAERWGWTADQVDNSPQWLVDRLPGVAAVVDEIEEDKRRAAAQQT
jgi:hypothetical protein